MREKPRQLGAALRVCCVIAAFAAPATAAPTLYHSPMDDGTFYSFPIAYATGGTLTLHLYMDEDDGSAVASSPTEACHVGAGEERCGWELTVESDGGVTFTGFVPNGDVIENLSSTTLRFTGGDVDQGELGPVKLGDLTIARPSDGTVKLIAGRVVGASLQTASLPLRTLITVPEPGMGVGLMAGVMALGLLSRMRSRS